MRTSSELERLTMPDLVIEALDALEEARRALSVLAKRVNPALAELVLNGDETQGEAVNETEVVQRIPLALRPLYTEFRRNVLSLAPGIEARLGPSKDGRLRYEGFFIGGRNRIYANFRKSFIRVNFELPEHHGYAADEVFSGGGREWTKAEIKSERDLERAVRLAKETVEAAGG